MSEQGCHRLFLSDGNDQEGYGCDDFENESNSKDNEGSQNENGLIRVKRCSHRYLLTRIKRNSKNNRIPFYAADMDKCLMKMFYCCAAFSVTT